jgi:hypothetical protein
VCRCLQTSCRPLQEFLDWRDAITRPGASWPPCYQKTAVILDDTERGARWILTIKGNQPRLRQQLAALPWRAIPNITPQQQSEDDLSGVVTSGAHFFAELLRRFPRSSRPVRRSAGFDDDRGLSRAATNGQKIRGDSGPRSTRQ